MPMSISDTGEVQMFEFWGICTARHILWTSLCWDAYLHQLQSQQQRLPRGHRASPLALQCIAALSHVNTGFHYALKLCVLGPCGPPRLPGSSASSSASASHRAPSSFCQQLSCCGAVEETCSQFYRGRLLCSGGKASLWFHALSGRRKKE